MRIRNNFADVSEVHRTDVIKEFPSEENIKKIFAAVSDDRRKEIAQKKKSTEIFMWTEEYRNIFKDLIKQRVCLLHVKGKITFISKIIKPIEFFNFFFFYIFLC